MPNPTTKKDYTDQELLSLSIADFANLSDAEAKRAQSLIRAQDGKRLEKNPDAKTVMPKGRSYVPESLDSFLVDSRKAIAEGKDAGGHRKACLDAIKVLSEHYPKVNGNEREWFLLVKVNWEGRGLAQEADCWRQKKLVPFTEYSGRPVVKLS